MDELSTQRLTQINPVLAERIRKLETLLVFEIRISHGYRSSDEQRAHFVQGRMAIRAVNNLRKKVGLSMITKEENVIVTNTPTFHSWHEYGLAVDILLMHPLPDFDENHPTWKRIVTIARELKLIDSVSFYMDLHLQPVEIPVVPTPLYISILQTKTIQDIWTEAGLVPEKPVMLLPDPGSTT